MIHDNECGLPCAECESDWSCDDHRCPMCSVRRDPAALALAARLRAGREAMPRATSEEAYAQQARALRGETRPVSASPIPPPDGPVAKRYPTAHHLAERILVLTSRAHRPGEGVALPATDLLELHDLARRLVEALRA